ncbi:MAG: hypothetical protein JSW52_06810 [Candidatus Coatesbacteria bacterium]|nr:MAG: hypothetical protein JSW52_06810 [Candidatus Coatesbacteria bacterium]
MRIRVVVLAVIAAALAGAGCAREATFPVYGFAGEAPWRTLTGTEDDAYGIGDMVSVKGKYYTGGTEGGSVIVLEVSKTPGIENDILEEYPALQRRFFLNRFEVEPDEVTVAEITGNVVADDVYHYGYLLDVLSAEAVEEPAADETRVRLDLADAADMIRRIDLDEITGSLHHQYNEGYEIIADPAAAEIAWAGTDYLNGLTVVKAMLEQLPPYESPQLYRELDAYLVYPTDGGECLWAVVCVGGYFLE